jgi:hypothetical protein
LKTTAFLITVLALVLAFAGVAYAQTLKGDNGPDTLIGTEKFDRIEGRGWG